MIARCDLPSVVDWIILYKIDVDNKSVLTFIDFVSILSKVGSEY